MHPPLREADEAELAIDMSLIAERLNTAISVGWKRCKLSQVTVRFACVLVSLHHQMEAEGRKLLLVPAVTP